MLRTLFAASLMTLLSACNSTNEDDRTVGELASDRIELTAEFAEPIVDIAVVEGEAVAAGQTLMRHDNARAGARLAEADAAYLQAKARLDELQRGPRREQIAAAKANLQGASRELIFRQSESQRIREISNRGLAAPDAVDKAEAALDAANAAHALRTAQLEELLAGTTVEELTQAEQLAKQAAARRDAAQIDFDRHTVVAPVSGLVDSHLFEVGERPGIGQPTLIVLAGEQPHARVYVPEKIRVRISPGTQASVFVDGLDEPFVGRVRWIASEPAFTPYFALTEHDRGRLTYVAKIDIPLTGERLPDGVPVDVDFALD